MDARAAAISGGDRGPSIVAVAVVGIVIPTIAVVLRFISRARAPRHSIGTWWDDWAVLVTLLFSHGFLAINITWTKYGLGRHYAAIPPSNAVTSNNLSHASIELFSLSLWLVKVSTLLLYARIFWYSRASTWTLWGVGAVSTAWGLCTSLVPWFNCVPVRKTIDLYAPGYCYNRMSWFYASVVINAIIDFVILLMPLPAVVRMRLELRKKLLVLAVFVLGYCSAFMSVARFILIVRTPQLMSTTPSSDPTWNIFPLLILSMLETPFAIVALCGPPIGQLATSAHLHGRLTSFLRTVFRTESKLRGSLDGDVTTDPDKETDSSRSGDKSGSAVPTIPQEAAVGANTPWEATHRPNGSIA